MKILFGNGIINSISSLLTFFIFTTMVFTCGNSLGNLPPVTNKTISVNGLLSDYDLLINSLHEGHPALYRYSSKDSVESLFKSYRDSIKKEMTEVEALRFFSKVVAIIKDGHTQARPSKINMDHIDMDSVAIPFVPLIQGDTMFVKRNYSNLSDKEFVGARILSINNTDVSDLLNNFYSFCPVDGNNFSRKLQLLQYSRLFVRFMYYLQGYHAEYEIKYIPYKSNTILTTTLKGIEYDNLIEIRNKKYPDLVSPFAECKLQHNISTAYLRINSFGKDQLKNNGVKNFPSFLETSFKLMNKSNLKNLILDLRNNLGGEDEYGKLVGAYLYDKDFDYYQSIQLNKESFDFFKYTTNAKDIKQLPEGMGKVNSDGTVHIIKNPNIGKQKPLQPTFKGKIYVLINGGCFSSCSELLTFLHYNVKPVFIGVESGGGYYGNCSGASATLLLPNTQLQIEIPIMKYTMAAKDYPYADRGIFPDYVVIPKIEDVLNNNDPEFEKAIELIKNDK